MDGLYLNMTDVLTKKEIRTKTHKGERLRQEMIDSDGGMGGGGAGRLPK